MEYFDIEVYLEMIVIALFLIMCSMWDVVNELKKIRRGEK